MADKNRKYELRRTTPWNLMKRNSLQDFIKHNHDETWERKHTRIVDANESELAMEPPSNKLEKVEIILDLAF